MMNKGVVYALWGYEAQNSDELSFHEGDALTILRRKDESETEWWWARLGDREGYVPKNLLGVSTASSLLWVSLVRPAVLSPSPPLPARGAAPSLEVGEFAEAAGGSGRPPTYTMGAAGVPALEPRAAARLPIMTLCSLDTSVVGSAVRTALRPVTEPVPPRSSRTPGRWRVQPRTRDAGAAGLGQGAGEGVGLTAPGTGSRGCQVLGEAVLWPGVQLVEGVGISEGGWPPSVGLEEQPAVRPSGCPLSAQRAVALS